MKFLFILYPLVLLNANVIIHQNEFCIKKSIASWIEIKNKNLVRQNFDYSCGSAALSTIMSHYYDTNTTEEAILNDILKAKGIDKDKQELQGQDVGLSFYDLSKYVSMRGLRAVGVAIDFEELKKLKIPVIVFIKLRKREHFSTLKKIDNSHVYLADPSFGNISVSHSKFKEMFYQRNDENMPGKILAILPTSSTVIKTDFMDTAPFGNITYEVIKRHLP